LRVPAINPIVGSGVGGATQSREENDEN